MREHEVGRPRESTRWHSWIKRISNVAAHVSAASLLAAGMASSLAARKAKNRHDHRGASDQGDRNRDRGSNRNREDRQANDPKEDRGSQRDNKNKSDGDGDGGNGHRGGKHEPQVDESSDVRSAQRATATPTPTPTSTPTSGGGGGGGGGGGKGDGGGNDTGNAGSGFFDSPLATKARRRANDFDNANRNEDDQRIIVDVDPEGESVYETDSVAFITSPDGIEIQTDNISYTALFTPTPEPLPRLELPVREPGYPFGEDFPFGDGTVTVGRGARESPDPGDTGAAPSRRTEPVPPQGSPSQPAVTAGTTRWIS